jgi:hypothetical protein
MVVEGRAPIGRTRPLTVGKTCLRNENKKKKKVK